MNRKTPASSDRDCYLDLFCFIRFISDFMFSNNFSKTVCLFDADLDQLLDDAVQRHLFEALRQMMHRPWWNRMWTIRDRRANKGQYDLWLNIFTVGDVCKRCKGFQSHSSQSAIFNSVRLQECPPVFLARHSRHRRYERVLEKAR
ncbi:uncharacterized protein K452DRAFT_47608 [Aplosporella prunicola CBS 121167]|uniref:Uncharacterized protein n=1 Tax=Aplosporella prunicola CBS 121167 TaxID=1176127 RepID=A0A6A6BC65_9PEZI|nr:uncharacterized protein K452DRAFT_47608 [Aplosporella prunicola CBS 121167]KAF2140507.1 hypothetical protein K452DRAFT_47608 [Aplosporella prunicola CBS 121167]